MNINKNVCIIGWNISGITSKEIEFYDYISKFDIICLSETWLKKKDENIILRKLDNKYKWEFIAAEKGG